MKIIEKQRRGKTKGLITNQDHIPGKECQSLIICLHSTWEDKWVSFHISCKWAKQSLSKVRKNCERLVHQSNGNSPAGTGFVKLKSFRRTPASPGRYLSQKRNNKWENCSQNTTTEAQMLPQEGWNSLAPCKPYLLLAHCCFHICIIYSKQIYYFKDSTEKAGKTVCLLRDTMLVFIQRLFLIHTLISKALPTLGFSKAFN